MFKLERKPKEYFEFDVDGESYKLPKINCLPLNDVKKLLSIAEEGASTLDIYDSFTGLFEKYAPGISDSLSPDEFEALWNAYSGGSESGE